MINSLISVVIPTKNRVDKLKRLLESLQQSRDVKIEIIVINDGGESFALPNEDIHVLTNRESRGLAYSRTLGARKSRGEYVLFIDDDNVVEADMIAKLAKSMEDNKSLMAVGPITYYLSSPKKIWFLAGYMNLFTTIPKFERNINRENLITPNLYRTGNLHNCFMIRRELGEEVGWFDEKIFMNGTEYDLFQRIKQEHPQLKLATDITASCYHDVPEYGKNFLRSLGFDNERRVYYFQRNRGLHVSRYGKWYEKLSLLTFFYPLFLLGYGSLFILKGKKKYLKNHLLATVAGYRYLLKGT